MIFCLKTEIICIMFLKYCSTLNADFSPPDPDPDLLLRKRTFLVSINQMSLKLIFSKYVFGTRNQQHRIFFFAGPVPDPDPH